MLYDDIGRTYAETRRADPRIASRIFDALGDAETVVNVGAGTGSYEPSSTVVAVEPSHTMIRQRPTASPPAIQAVAEALPLPDKCADAASALSTIHHWTDLSAGVAEMCRVARRRLVFFTHRPERFAQFWLVDEYLPEAVSTGLLSEASVDDLLVALPTEGVRVDEIAVPHDCTDGFGAAYWRRPEAYLEPIVQAGISLLAKADAAQLKRGLARLQADTRSGAWQEKHADLLDLEELDVGYCTVTVDM